MSGVVQERATATPMTANATFTLTGSNILGFLAVTAGTVTVTDPTGKVLVNAVPVAAGQWLKIPFYVGIGGTVTLAGGASGTLATY